MNLALKICNAVGFYIGWFVCVTFGNFAAVTFTAAFIAINLFWQHQLNKNLNLKKEIYWLGIVATLGILIDSILFSTNVLVSLTPLTSFYSIIFPPVWLVCLWVLFASSLRISLTWLLRKTALCFLLVALFAPLNYWIGATIVPEIDIPISYVVSLPSISVLWLCFLWLLVTFKQYAFEDIFHDY